MRTKFYSMYGKATDKDGREHIVTVVAQVEQTKDYVNNAEPLPYVDEYMRERDAMVIYQSRQMTRTLKLGYSICHPNDTFNEAIGVGIAKRRIKQGNFIGELTTHNCTMLNDDSNNMLVFSELNYIIKNIDKYLPIEED